MAAISATPIMPCVIGVSGTCQADDVGNPKELSQTFDRLGVAVTQLVGQVEVDHPHAHRLGKVRELTADIAVADDAERLAADFVAVARRLVPSPRMGSNRARKDAAEQHHDLADHQLGDAAGV
jgi:hypothetical protein